jgi:hypothetical protein
LKAVASERPVAYRLLLEMWFRILMTLAVVLVAAAKIAHSGLRIAFVVAAVLVGVMAWGTDISRGVRRRAKT